MSHTNLPHTDNLISFPGLLGTSAATQQVFKIIKKVADTDTTILISGESGTGKELIARAIHQNSKRNKNPLIAINCGAIPEGLMESDLFGHEKGAFTGAMKTRIGKFEAADQSTLFLDEVGDMPSSLQVKILRILQEQEFERVGGTTPITVDVRIIAATNKDLEKAIQDDKFREDLYYRLNVIPITIPPLRERKEEIPVFIDYFSKRFNQTKKRAIHGISEEAMDIMLNYKWPGNIRELENIMERMVILKGEGEIGYEDIPDNIIRQVGKTPNKKNLPDDTIRVPLPNAEENSSPETYIPDEGVSLKKIIADLEKDFIISALKKSNGVKNRAAKLLGLNRTTLIEKMKKLGIF